MDAVVALGIDPTAMSDKPDDGLHEVVKGLYIGSQQAAKNLDALKKHKVTHIINPTKGVQNFYPDQFKYKSEAMTDESNFDISPFLDDHADFIHDALHGGGKVLCHCNAGVSRSSTLILAYLIKWKKLTWEVGLEKIQKVRPIARPNGGFIKRLEEFELRWLYKKITKV